MRITKIPKLTLMVLGLASLGLFLLDAGTASASNPTTMNFQGKVVNADGTNVSNGTYPFIFRIYNTASPTTTTSCTTTASCLWEETQSSVTVTNGVFQVELGSACALTSASCNNSTGGPINWSSTSSLYLTMKFNGDSAGFMSPTIHITSVPFAFNADQLGGISASGFIQNNSGSAQSSSSYHIDGTGIADTQLQAPLFDTATSAGTLGIGATNAGAITLGNVTNSTFLFNTKSSATAFQVQNANSRNLLAVDTQNSIVQIGNSTDGSAITLAATGNANATIRKSTAVTGAVNAHDIVMLDTTNAGQVVQDNSNAVPVFGVATTTNASAATQDIVTGGIYQVNLSTTSVAVAIGDDLLAVGSGDPGKAKDGGPCDSTRQMVGRALEAKSAGVGGLIWALISPSSGNTSQGNQGACPLTGSTLQQAYNTSTGGTTPEIKLSTSQGGLDIQDANTTINASLFAVRASNSSGLGTAMFSVDNNGLATLQPAANLASGQTEITQTLTNGSSTGGTVQGYSQAITVSNTSSASTTNGINIAITDATTLANTTNGINISLTNSGAAAKTESGLDSTVTDNASSSGSTNIAISAVAAGSNTGQLQYAVDASANHGVAIRGASTGYGGNISCGGTSLTFGSIGVCGSTNGQNTSSYGGYFVNSGSNGTALYASNGSGVSAKLLDLQVNSTDAFLVSNVGAVTVTPQGNNAGTIIRQTTATATSGNIFDIQGANGTSHFIQVTETAANAGSISITSLGSNGLTLQAGSGTISLGSSTALSATGALTIASGGTSALTLDSLSGTLALGANTTTLQKSAASFTLDVTNSSASTLNVTNSGAGGITLNLDSGGSYAVGGTAGTTASACSAGNFVTGTLSGGIVTGGSCGAPTVTLQNAYDASSSPVTITTSSASKTITVVAGSAPTDDLFTVDEYNGANTVTTTGLAGLKIITPKTNGSSGFTYHGLDIEGPASQGGNDTDTGIYIGTGWDIGIDINSGGIQLAAQSDPSAPAAEELRIYAKDIAGRVLPKWIGPAGVDTPIQASFGFNRISMFAPAGSGSNCGTSMSSYGSTGVGSANGSATGCSYPALASTNLATSIRRFRYTTGTTAGTVAYQRQAATMVWRGGAAAEGGFFFTTRFTLNAVQTGNRAFVGLEDSVANPTNVDPTTSTASNKIGMAINASTGDWDIINNVAGTAPTVTNLGATIPVNTSDLLELVLYSAPNGTSIGWRVTDISAGAQTSGSQSTNIPATTTFLAPQFWITNNATAAAAIMDNAGWYLESDN
ncbi:MAG: beta strand repeat-containing protein [Candidatus Saccharimonadales bacterium]